MVRKVFVLDTNVLLYDPGSLYHFDEHEVVIPLTVIEEVDRFKKDLNETGRNARTVSRYLEEARGTDSLREGVELPNGGRLRVDFAMFGPELPINWGPETNDNRIIRCALRLNEKTPGQVVLITRDTNMRLKCNALGVHAEDYQHSRIQVDEQYSGVRTLDVPPIVIDDLYQQGSVPLEGELGGLFPQQFIILNADDSSGKTAMARVDERRNRLRLVGRHKEGVWGIFARNKEQLFAMDLLLDPAVKLVTLNGLAGSGKTLIALACALKLALDDGHYRKVLVSRPIFPLGKDIGFLPGDIEEKLNPWMKPIFDNLDLLFSSYSDRGSGSKRGGDSSRQYSYLLDKKLLEVEPLTYIRGRSIPHQILIVDEAQNLTPHEVKTVLTRAGEGTKVIMTGDPGQIDNPYVDALSNGLTYTIERFKRTHIAGHVTLQKGERSELAELAAEVL